jgi:hypothetical protein
MASNANKSTNFTDTWTAKKRVEMKDKIRQQLEELSLLDIATEKVQLVELYREEQHYSDLKKLDSIRDNMKQQLADLEGKYNQKREELFKDTQQKYRRQAAVQGLSKEELQSGLEKVKASAMEEKIISFENERTTLLKELSALDAMEREMNAEYEEDMKTSMSKEQIKDVLEIDAKMGFSGIKGYFDDAKRIEKTGFKSVFLKKQQEEAQANAGKGDNTSGKSSLAQMSPEERKMKEAMIEALLDQTKQIHDQEASETRMNDEDLQDVEQYGKAFQVDDDEDVDPSARVVADGDVENENENDYDDIRGHSSKRKGGKKQKLNDKRHINNNVNNGGPGMTPASRVRFVENQSKDADIAREEDEDMENSDNEVDVEHDIAMQKARKQRQKIINQMKEQKSASENNSNGRNARNNNQTNDNSSKGNDEMEGEGEGLEVHEDGSLNQVPGFDRLTPAQRMKMIKDAIKESTPPGDRSVLFKQKTNANNSNAEGKIPKGPRRKSPLLPPKKNNK